MRLGILALVLTATIFGSSFWYDFFVPACRVPVVYTVGEIDARFGTTPEEIVRIAARAETLWEESIGKDVFVFDSERGLPINLVFDERQETSEREAELREDLESKEGMSESVAAQYDVLIAEFRALRKQHESQLATYESSLEAYNAEVGEWNDAGGAPQNVVDELEQKKENLRTEYERLQADSKVLNGIVTELNRIGARGNLILADYNSSVREYNTHFGDEHEFTQGDYSQDAINVYQFDSEDELVIVLAHEFGHALALGHVGNEESIMYHFMEKQDIAVGLTPEDVAHYSDVCEADRGFFSFLRALVALW